MADFGTYSDWLRQNPELVNQAVARAAPQPVAPAYQPPEAPSPVQAPSSKNPQRALAELQGQQVSAQNDIASSHIREGDAKATGAQSRADVIAANTPKARRYIEAAEKNHDDNKIRQEKMKDWMDEDMRTLREPPVEPERWQKAVGILSGIVGATAQGYLGAPGAGIAYGMSALQDHLNKSITDQLTEQDQAGRNLAHTEKALDTLGKDSSDELDIASKLVANHWFATSKELEKISEEAKVPEYKESAQRLALEATSRGREILARNYEQQIAQARAATAARAKGSRDWGQYSLGQLEAWEKSNALPLDGVNALNDARKKAREAKGDEAPWANPQIAGLEPIPGATVTKVSFDKAQHAKIMLDKVSQHLGRAKQLATEPSSWYPYNNDRLKVEGQYAGQKASALALISQLVEAGVLNEGDAERFAGGLPEPDAVFRNDMSPEAKKAVYDEMLSNFRRTSEDGLRTLGFTTKKAAFTPAGPPAGTGAAQGTKAPRVTMYDPNGAPILVKQGLVEQFRDNGYTTTAPRRGPAVSEMSDADYEAHVRAESGY